VAHNLARARKKVVVGEPDEGKPHVRFDVAGDENQDTMSQASSLDPTNLTRLSLRSSLREGAAKNPCPRWFGLLSPGQLNKSLVGKNKGKAERRKR